MNSILSGLLFFILLYLIFDILVKQSSFGLTPTDISLTLFGDEEAFMDALSPSSFLEFIHTEIFFMMMILLTLSSVFIRLSKNFVYASLLTNTTMVAGLLSLLFLALAFYISAFFVLLFSISFFVWHIGAIGMSLYAFWRLNFARSL